MILTLACSAAGSLAPSVAHAAVDYQRRPHLQPGVAMSAEQHRAWVGEIMRPREGEPGLTPQPLCASPVTEANRLLDGSVAALVNNLTGGERKRVLPGARGDAFGVAHMRTCMARHRDDNRIVELRSPDPSEVPHEEGGLLYMSRYATMIGDGASGAADQSNGGGSIGMATGGAVVAAAGGQFLMRGHGGPHRHARIDPTLGPFGLRFSVSF